MLFEGAIVSLDERPSMARSTSVAQYVASALSWNVRALYMPPLRTWGRYLPLGSFKIVAIYAIHVQTLYKPRITFVQGVWNVCAIMWKNGGFDVR